MNTFLKAAASLAAVMVVGSCSSSAGLASESKPKPTASRATAAPTTPDTAAANRRAAATTACIKADLIIGDFSRNPTRATMHTAIQKLGHAYDDTRGAVAVAGTEVTFDLSLIQLAWTSGGSTMVGEAKLKADLPKLTAACRRAGYTMDVGN